MSKLLNLDLLVILRILNGKGIQNNILLNDIILLSHSSKAPISLNNKIICIKVFNKIAPNIR